MNSIHDPRYIKLIEALTDARKRAKLTQRDLAKRLRLNQSDIAKIERSERRLDIIEVVDWLKSVDADPLKLLSVVGLLAKPGESESPLPPLPEPGRVARSPNGCVIPLAWKGKVLEVAIDELSPSAFLRIEKELVRLFRMLNSQDPKMKNREAIAAALEFAINRAPNTNPSDIYHHIVYRLYIREYNKTQADRSWVRAGGEAVEIFLCKRYNPILKRSGIKLVPLIRTDDKKQALADMGISKDVGGSKLDIALYGQGKRQKEQIFGGIHVKASLAERVSDDIPCSEAMMRSKFTSILLTFDAKSFPPPQGDLVNRGELGTIMRPSDKRKYIEEHGAFSACVSYNTRTQPSPPRTPSGRRIYSGDFSIGDPLPRLLKNSWATFRRS